MEVYRWVVELGSFAKAADRLDMSRASVTTHVAQLENLLGVRLLNRTTRRLALTDDGAAYLEHCKRILADVEETVTTLQRGRAVPHGPLRVDMPGAIARLIVIPALPRFIDQYPELQVTLISNDQVINLIEAGVDIAIRVGALADSSMVARRIHQLEGVACASPDYLEDHGIPITPQELGEHRCLGYFNVSTGRVVDWHFEKNGERHVHLPVGRIAISDPEALVDLAIDGKGIVYHADLVMRRAIAAGQLVPVLSDWTENTATPVSVVYAQNRHLSAKVRAFSDFVAGLFPRAAGQRATTARDTPKE